MKSHLIPITAAVAVCMPPAADSFGVRPIPRGLRRPRCLPAVDRAGDATSAETDADATTAPAPRAEGHMVEISHEGWTANVFVHNEI